MSEERTEDIGQIERGVVGCLLMSAELDGGADTARIMGLYERKGMDAEWFIHPEWREVWEACRAEWLEHRCCDPMLVARRIEKNGARTVAEAIGGTPTVAHAEYYAEVLRDNRLYRMLRKLCITITHEAEPGNVSLKLEDLAKGMREIQGLAAKADGGLVKVSELREGIMSEMRKLSEERFVKGNRKYLIGLPMMWDCLNSLYMGLKPGLHIVAALPSNGKTTFGAGLSLFWLQRGIKHAFVCIDMQPRELVKRYAAMRKQVSLAKMNWGGSPEDVARFGEGLENGEPGSEGYVDLDGVEMSESFTVERLRDEWYRGVFTHGWKAIIVDYLQLVKDPSVKASATYEKVAAVTQAVKQLYKELNIPIVCLVQLSREAGKNYRDTNRRPSLEDLGDSAEIARAASTVAILAQDNEVAKWWKTFPPSRLAWGGSYHDEATRRIVVLKGQEYLAKKLRPVWYYLVKNQQGPTGEVPMVMYPSYFMFRPGNWDAKPETVEIGGKEKKINTPFFEQLRDDWMRNEGDDILERTGAMGYRGIPVTEEERRQEQEMKKRAAWRADARPDERELDASDAGFDDEDE